MKITIWIRNGFCLGLLLLSGCGESDARVSGEVTYEGQPVESGNIAFLPADGKGQPVGATITKGKYSVSEMPPGSKMVRIASNKNVVFPKSRMELKNPTAKAEFIKKMKDKNKDAKSVPPNAEGNNRQVDVVIGNQQLDFHLTMPASK